MSKMKSVLVQTGPGGENEHEADEFDPTHPAGLAIYRKGKVVAIYAPGEWRAIVVTRKT